MPISDCDVRDPRMRRTRQLLQEALRKLLQTKRLDEILVQDITDAATVNRATFYDHYSDKFAIFEAMIAGDSTSSYKNATFGLMGLAPLRWRPSFWLCAGTASRFTVMKTTVPDRVRPVR
jgi:AcrR family transcriptional regulator